MYKQIKQKQQDRVAEIHEKNQVFYAFNQEQLQEGIEKFNISEDNKMVSIGMGGYLPSKNLANYKKDWKEFDKEAAKDKVVLQQNKKELEKAIVYELENYECFYTYDLEPVCNVFPNVNASTISSVFNKYKDQYDCF